MLDDEEEDYHLVYLENIIEEEKDDFIEKLIINDCIIHAKIKNIPPEKIYASSKFYLEYGYIQNTKKAELECEDVYSLTTTFWKTHETLIFPKGFGLVPTSLEFKLEKSIKNKTIFVLIFGNNGLLNYPFAIFLKLSISQTQIVHMPMLFHRDTVLQGNQILFRYVCVESYTDVRYLNKVLLVNPKDPNKLIEMRGDSLVCVSDIFIKQKRPYVILFTNLRVRRKYLGKKGSAILIRPIKTTINIKDKFFVKYDLIESLSNSFGQIFLTIHYDSDMLCIPAGTEIARLAILKCIFDPKYRLVRKACNYIRMNNAYSVDLDPQKLPRDTQTTKVFYNNIIETDEYADQYLVGCNKKRKTPKRMKTYTAMRGNIRECLARFPFAKEENSHIDCFHLPGEKIKNQ